MKLGNSSSFFRLALLMPLLTLSFFISLACSKESGSSTQDPNAATAGPEKKAADLSPEERKTESEILTDEGEDLLQPSSLSDAHAKFKEALQFDPQNVRAAFLDAMIGPTLEFKGILARVKPFYTKQPYGAERYARMLDRTFEGRHSAWRSYLLSGPADIDSAEGVQEWMDRVLLRMSQYREVIKANKHETLEIRLPEDFVIFVGVFSSSSNGKVKCRPTQLGPIKVQTRSCNQKGYLDFELNRADLEILQNGWGAIELYLSFLNAYTWNPEFVVTSGDSSTVFTERGKRIDWMSAFGNGRFGQLRSRQTLSTFKSLIADAAISLRYMVNNQDEACGAGAHKPRHFVISDSFCLQRLSNFHNPVERYLTAFETIVAGEPLELPQKTQSGGPIAIKPLLFLEEPLTALSQLGPFTWNDDQHIVGFNTSALDRYFASGSAVDLLRATEAKRLKRTTETEP